MLVWPLLSDTTTVSIPQQTEHRDGTERSNNNQDCGHSIQPHWLMFENAQQHAEFCGVVGGGVADETWEVIVNNC